MDDNGGTLKNCVYCNVMSRKCEIDAPKQFVKHADKAVKGITSLYLSADISIEPDEIEASPRINGTFQIQIIKRFFNEQNVPYLQFSKMATDEKPFFAQFYGEEACGPLLIITIVVHALETMNRLKNSTQYVRVWFHTNCFFD